MGRNVLHKRISGIDDELGQDEADVHCSVGRDQDGCEFKAQMPPPFRIQRQLHLLQQVLEISGEVDDFDDVIPIETAVNKRHRAQTLSLNKLVLI